MTDPGARRAGPRELAGFPDPHGAARALRARGRDVLLLDAPPGHDDAWGRGALLALRSRELVRWRRGDGEPDPLGRLSRRIVERVARRGSPDTGVLALLGYELRAPDRVPARDDDGLPECIAWEVDAAVRWDAGGVARLAGDADPDALSQAVADTPPATVEGEVRTSLPRDKYLRALDRVLERIARGDIYQANLCQRFAARYRGDPLELYRRLAPRAAAPRSAYLQSGRLAVASVSPETFVTVRDGTIETWPIKGTRPRGATAAEDRAAADSLLASPKDRAELLMIVDLERNDLGRVCRTGSVEVPVLARLDSFAAVHHLVARVRGALADGVDPAGWIEAVFPGGSITGAPKRSAMEILATLEPVRRNFFTGSLVWFGDDGSVESSILIRTAVFDGRRVFVGAGGGVVADSDPVAEVAESNHKARALAGALGFEPEAAC